MPYIDINKRIITKNYSMNHLHTHTHYEIYFLVEGNRLLFFSDKMYEITKPTIVIIPPQTLHKTEGGPFVRFNLSVFRKGLNRFQEDTLQKCSLKLIEPDRETLQTLIGLFDEFINLKEENYKQNIAEALFSYFVYLLSKLDIKSAKRASYSNYVVPPIILKIMDYLNNNLTENITLEDISKEFYIAKSTLNYNFKRYTSCTPIEYLLNLRLEKAKRLLAETNKSIEEISLECGFSSPNYFGTIFKRHINISPSAYRKSY